MLRASQYSTILSQHSIDNFDERAPRCDKTAPLQERNQPTVFCSFARIHSPAVVDPCCGGLSGEQQVGMHSIAASKFGWWKNTVERRESPATSRGGLTTRCMVDTQRSLVHTASKSPRLMTKLFFDVGHVEPTAIPQLHLQTTVGMCLIEDGQTAVVGMRAAPQLPGQRGFRLRRVKVGNQVGCVLFAVRHEPAVR